MHRPALVRENIKLARQQGIRLHHSILSSRTNKWSWAVHHSTTLIAEATYEPIQNRVNFILREKLASQRPTRLVALRPVKDVKKLKELMENCRVRENRVYEAANILLDCFPIPGLCASRHLRDKSRHLRLPVRQVQDTCTLSVREKYAALLLKQWDKEYPHHPTWKIGHGLVF